MQAFRVSIKGVEGLPLLLHNERLANKMDPLVKEMAAITSKRTKTDEDQEQISRIEFEGGLYLNHEGLVGIPAWNIFRCIQDGAKLNRLGKSVERAVNMMPPDVVVIEHDGPSTPKAMWDARCFDQRSVKVGTAKVTRTRPAFRNWSLSFDCVLFEDVLNFDDFKMVVANAGAMNGLGDYRPRFGKFDVVSIEPL